MLTLDRPSDASSYEYRRLYGEQPEPPEYVAWLKEFGAHIRAAFDEAPEDMDREFYNALQAAADAVARAEERGYREGWM